REAHGRVYAAALADGGERAAVAQMTRDQPQRREIATQNLGRATGAVPMADAVKAIAANALLVPFVGSRIDRSRHLDGAVKGRVKNRHLRDFANHSFGRLNGLEVGAVVQRRERRQASDGCFYFGSDERRLPVVAPAVDNS